MDFLRSFLKLDPAPSKKVIETEVTVNELDRLVSTASTWNTISPIGAFVRKIFPRLLRLFCEKPQAFEHRQSMPNRWKKTNRQSFSELLRPRQPRALSLAEERSSFARELCDQSFAGLDIRPGIIGSFPRSGEHYKKFLLERNERPGRD